MALFEGGNAGAPPASLGFPPSNHRPSFEHEPGSGPSKLPPPLYSTGVHDRPYRFSFYSNALSATIHARSLSELPAEGQSFEDLFTGLNNSGDRPDGVNVSRPGTSMGFNGNGSNGNGAAARATGILSPHPSLHPSGLSKMAGNELRSRSGTMNGPGMSNADGNTWWLDVQSPTDEEMKLLSKVMIKHLLEMYRADY